MLRLLTAISVAASCAQGAAARRMRGGKPNLCQPGHGCMLDSFIVVPEHKLLFCYIEKVGCKNFNELFRRLRSRYDPSLLEGPWAERNTPKVHNLTKADLEEMLVSEEWHKAVFWRQPLERFASAWTSKCAGGHDIDGPRHCQNQFGENTPYPLPFEETVAFLANHDLEEGIQNDTAFDRHWKLQLRYCGGLDTSLQHYDTVEELTLDTAHAKVSKLLATVGVDPGSIEGFNELFPDTEAAGGAWARDSHHTNASNLSYFYPRGEPWRQDIVKRHYWQDHNLFGIKQPDIFLRKAELSIGDDELPLQWPLANFL